MSRIFATPLAAYPLTPSIFKSRSKSSKVYYRCLLQMPASFTCGGSYNVKRVAARRCMPCLYVHNVIHVTYLILLRTYNFGT
eukprot:1101146-Amphidinium_carterae.1